MKARQFLREIEKRGFKLLRQKGTHMAFRHESTGTMYISSEAFRDVPPQRVKAFSRLAVELGEEAL